MAELERAPKKNNSTNHITIDMNNELAKPQHKHYPTMQTHITQMSGMWMKIHNINKVLNKQETFGHSVSQWEETFEINVPKTSRLATASSTPRLLLARQV